MTPTRLLVATRNPDKLREIAQLLSIGGQLELVDLRMMALPADSIEDELERFDSFEENALAKARYFAERSGMRVLAEDSGLCVDALAGAPGVRSKRFSGRTDLTGARLDDANNRLLLHLLEGFPLNKRTAHYFCAAALAHVDGSEDVVSGRCEGTILTRVRGFGGFGYDPLFFLPAENATFGELDPTRKNQLSHRAAAMRNLVGVLRTRGFISPTCGRGRGSSEAIRERSR